PVTKALSLSTTVMAAPSRLLTSNVLPSTFSMVPRTRTGEPGIPYGARASVCGLVGGTASAGIAGGGFAGTVGGGAPTARGRCGVAAETAGSGAGVAAAGAGAAPAAVVAGDAVGATATCGFDAAGTRTYWS